MLRCFILCCLMVGGLSLSAQSTAKANCAATCQAKKVSATTPSCQAKTTSVAAVSTPAPARATNTTAPAVPYALPVGLTTPKANCNPADCIKICEPTNCDPAACKPANCKPGANTSTSTAATRTTTIAMKQE